MAVALTRDRAKTEKTAKPTTYELLSKDARDEAIKARSQMDMCEAVLTRVAGKNRIRPDLSTNAEVQATVNFQMAKAKFIVKIQHWRTLRGICSKEGN